MKVSHDRVKKLNDFIDSLPAEAKEKCKQCNETLTHIVKQAETITGAPTLTVCRAIAEETNKGAVATEKVTARALENRVRRNEGKVINANRVDKDSGETNHTASPIVRPAATETVKTKEVKRQTKDETRDFMREIEKASEEFEAAFKQMSKAIINARSGGWISTTKIAASRRLDSLLNLIQ